MFWLDDRVVVVTGGLGQLGQNFVQGLQANGARVAIIEHPTIVTAVAISTAAESNTLLIGADICDKAALFSAREKIQEHYGVTPFGLVNCAAIDSPPGAPAAENGPFEDYPEASWDKVMAANAKGSFLCCQVFGGAMALQGAGSIVNISSIYGILSPDQSLYEYRRERGEKFYKPVAYSASKSAVLNLTRYLATYWGRKGVRVNTMTLAGVFNDQDAEFLQGYEGKVPLGRMASPTEYNGSLIFLMSDASSYMTGANMIIDGGFSAW